jgi:hypothetical protein
MKKADIDREYRKFAEQWLPKYSERLQLSLLNMKDKRDIREDDWEVLRVAFRNYYFGQISFPNGNPRKSYQNKLQYLT